MKDNQNNIYEYHHAKSRELGFSILKKERGELIRDIIGEGKTVLDIGCRDGALTQYFVSGNKVLGVDIDNNALKEASKLGIEVKNVNLNGDWEELVGRNFDVVVAGEILEHLYYPDKILTKISDHLINNGLLIGSVPNAFSVKNRIRYLFGKKTHTPLADPTHINQFHIEELRAFLKRYFRKVEIKGLGRYARLATLSPGLFGFDLFFICHK